MPNEPSGIDEHIVIEDDIANWRQIIWRFQKQNNPLDEARGRRGNTTTAC
jgi:hypothetical protein